MRASAIAGLIFANTHDENLARLTGHRSMSSVPFGGSYRLIDFALSNLVNAGIGDIALLTKVNYRSLMDHVGSGLYWDLDRKAGGLYILPPYSIQNVHRYTGTVEALYGALDFVRRSSADYIVICEGDVVANVDIRAAVEAHLRNAAEITVVYQNGTVPTENRETMCLDMDAEDRVRAVRFDHENKAAVCYNLGITVMDAALLTETVRNAYENDRVDFNRDIISACVPNHRVYGFRHDGFSAIMESERSYFKANMALLENHVRKDLFNPERPIYTKTRDDMPTRYGTHADVKNSLIAEGCVIEGTVRNSVLFRGVKIGKGAVVENSILMQGVSVEENVRLANVVSDKNARVGAEMVLKGTENEAFLVRKNQIV